MESPSGGASSSGAGPCSGPHNSRAPPLTHQSLGHATPDQGQAQATPGQGQAHATLRKGRGHVTPGHQPGPRTLRDAPRNDGPPASDRHRVIVTGYPGYTQAQDLLRVFAKIGNVKVEQMYTKCSVLSYTTAEEMGTALLNHKKFNIYGQFVSVVPYSDKYLVEEGRHAMRKDYKKNKVKVPTIDPAQIDLTGDFHGQLDNILAAVRLTQENVTTLSKLYTDVELVLQALWPGCTAIPFGSITTGLGIKSSDADCFVDVPPQFRHPNANFVTKAKRLLQQHPKYFTEILSIPRANTPIVKFFHIPTDTYCDLTFKTPLGAQNSKLIGFLLHSDPRLIPMAVFIKYWAKIHDISGTGKLTNYALTMMIIFYLQQQHVDILPSVECLQRDSANDEVIDFWNTGFMCKREYLRPTKNRASISEILGGFFEYYAMFNFDELTVCPYLGVPLKKMVFRDLYTLPKEFERYRVNVLQGNVMPLRFNTPICVQDPFEQSHNVASAITVRLAQDIKEYFKFAANVYEKSRVNRCETFLRTILIEKPKLIEGRYHPEYRVNLYPRLIATIVDPDWKLVVRETVHTIFEKMMRIKLGKVEEKLSSNSMKVKERYDGVLTKPIWKRKQLNKLYSMMNMDFQQREERITDEIMKIDRQVLKIGFQLSITFNPKSQNAVLAVQLSTGDVDAFREFGKFFISVTRPWFVNLLGLTTGKTNKTTQESAGNGSQDTDDESPDSPDADKDAVPTSPTSTDEGGQSAPASPN